MSTSPNINIPAAGLYGLPYNPVSLADFARGENVAVPMAKFRAETDDLFTIFRVVAAGRDPLVNVLQTVEGRDIGPSVYLMGSIACEEELYHARPPIHLGLIVPGQRLVIYSEAEAKLLPIKGFVGDRPPLRNTSRRQLDKLISPQADD